jgi:hypothetical protein
MFTTFIAAPFRHLPSMVPCCFGGPQALLVLLFRALSRCDDVSRLVRDTVGILEPKFPVDPVKFLPRGSQTLFLLLNSQPINRLLLRTDHSELPTPLAGEPGNLVDVCSHVENAVLLNRLVDRFACRPIEVDALTRTGAAPTDAVVQFVEHLPDTARFHFESLPHLVEGEIGHPGQFLHGTVGG